MKKNGLNSMALGLDSMVLELNSMALGLNSAGNTVVAYLMGMYSFYLRKSRLQYYHVLSYPVTIKISYSFRI